MSHLAFESNANMIEIDSPTSMVSGNNSPVTLTVCRIPSYSRTIPPKVICCQQPLYCPRRSFWSLSVPGGNTGTARLTPIYHYLYAHFAICCLLALGNCQHDKTQSSFNICREAYVLGYVISLLYFFIKHALSKLYARILVLQNLPTLS